MHLKKYSVNTTYYSISKYFFLFLNIASIKQTSNCRISEDKVWQKNLLKTSIYYILEKHNFSQFTDITHIKKGFISITFAKLTA